MDEGAGGGELRRHVGQHPLQALELADRPAELLAPAAVGQRLLVGALGDAERHGGRPDALGVVGGHERAEAAAQALRRLQQRSEEHTSELQSLMRISYAVFCLKQTKIHTHESNNDIYADEYTQ